MKITCTICSDTLEETDSIYMVKCGHVFHQHCLDQWIKTSKTCPQCRNQVTEECIFRLYFALTDDSIEDKATLQTDLADVRRRISLYISLKAQYEEFIKENIKLTNNLQALQRKLCENAANKSELRSKVYKLKQEKAIDKNNITELKTRLSLAEKKLSQYELKCQELTKRKASVMGDQSKETASKQSRFDRNDTTNRLPQNMSDGREGHSKLDTLLKPKKRPLKCLKPRSAIEKSSQSLGHTSQNNKVIPNIWEKPCCSKSLK